MPGAGYDIGASLAQSFSIPLTANTSTTINFGQGTFYNPQTNDVTSEPVSVATTKSPGTTNNIGGTGSGQTNAVNPSTGYPQDLGIAGLSAGGNSNTLIYVALAILATLVLVRRH